MGGARQPPTASHGACRAAAGDLSCHRPGGADPILHEGIVDLLRGKSAVIDDLQIVDPGTVIKAAGMGSQGEVMDVGLAARVLDASGRTQEAAEARATYRELWADADGGISLPGG